MPPISEIAGIIPLSSENLIAINSDPLKTVAISDSNYHNFIRQNNLLWVKFRCAARLRDRILPGRVWNSDAKKTKDS